MTCILQRVAAGKVRQVPVFGAIIIPLDMIAVVIVANLEACVPRARETRQRWGLSDRHGLTLGLLFLSLCMQAARPTPFTTSRARLGAELTSEPWCGLRARAAVPHPSVVCFVQEPVTRITHPDFVSGWPAVTMDFPELQPLWLWLIKWLARGMAARAFAASGPNTRPLCVGAVRPPSVILHIAHAHASHGRTGAAWLERHGSTKASARHVDHERPPLFCGAPGLQPNDASSHRKEE
jgi:hypothetical protein